MGFYQTTNHLNITIHLKLMTVMMIMTMWRVVVYMWLLIWIEILTYPDSIHGKDIIVAFEHLDYEGSRSNKIRKRTSNPDNLIAELIQVGENRAMDLKQQKWRDVSVFISDHSCHHHLHHHHHPHHYYINHCHHEYPIIIIIILLSSVAIIIIIYTVDL